ncbi:MAG: hypothetical protein CME66_10415 [Halobacteriovoraceae bacterium]|jgi:hypothetical protein|nr:hypothetical protein [Halobacteriovoraceae bacterium]|tara:strand:- start:327 stop:950 length:624 start_codon:yes stop_codon:yes gene_type:complete
MKTLLSLILCVISLAGWSQDESFYRDIFSGAFIKKKKPFEYKVLVESPRYSLDLDRDGVKDSFQTLKKDGVDFIRINNAFGEKVFESSLLNLGQKSKIFKAHLKTISKTVDVLILYFYEGYNYSSNFGASARLYFLTIPDRKLDKITLTKGPYFWGEFEKAAGKYWRRRLSVNTLDYNGDGKFEISVSYNKTSRVFFYLPSGNWTEI